MFLLLNHLRHDIYGVRAAGAQGRGWRELGKTYLRRTQTAGRRRWRVAGGSLAACLLLLCCRAAGAGVARARRTWPGTRGRRAAAATRRETATARWGDGRRGRATGDGAGASVSRSRPVSASPAAAPFIGPMGLKSGDRNSGTDSKPFYFGLLLDE